MDMLSAGGGHMASEPQYTFAPTTPLPIDPANVQSSPSVEVPDQGGDIVAPHPIDPTTQAPIPNVDVSDRADAQFAGVGQPSPETGPEVHPASGGHFSPDLGIIVALWRQRQDLGRAHQRLDLQCQAVIRRYSDGDKATAAKRWAAIQRGADDEVAPILIPYRLAMAPLAEARHALELQLAKRARKLPLWTEWAKDVRGMGELSLAGLIGEAGRGLTEYRSVSALWKRMGLAVIGGERQRRVAGDAAILHGYAPQRRAYAYVLSTNLMRSQKAGDPYRALYDARKAYELAREIPKAHAHNRALRVMVKALLRDAWRAERDGGWSPPAESGPGDETGHGTVSRSQTRDEPESSNPNTRANDRTREGEHG